MSETRPESHSLAAQKPRTLLTVVVLAVLGAVLWLARGALTPFAVGLVLVYLVSPAVDRLERRLPRWAAVLLVYGLIVLGLAIGTRLLAAPILSEARQFATNLPGYLEAADRQLRGLSSAYAVADLSPEVRAALDAVLGDLGGQLGGLGPTLLVPLFRSVTGIAYALLGYLIVPVWAFYVLKDRPALARSALAVLPDAWRPDAVAVGGIVDRVLGRWLRAQLILGGAVGLLTLLGLMALAATVDPALGRYALLLALVAGLLEMLPIIGPILAAVPALILGLTVSPQATMLVFLLYLGIQQVENNLLVPRIQGDALRLHPSAVIFAIVAGGAAFGIVGAVLAAPATAAGRDVAIHLWRRLGDEVRDEVRDEPASTTPRTRDRALGSDSA